MRNDAGGGLPGRHSFSPWTVGPDSADRAAMAESPHRRLPASWHADKIPGGYVIRDANGQVSPTYILATTKPKLGRQRS
jgi:hypothetical protein